MGKVNSVCIRCVLILQRMRVESRVFYPTISKQSCHVQHSTFSQNAAGHSIFNIQEFQTAFSTLFCTVSKRILHRKSAYNVTTVCSFIAENARWITCVLSDDIKAILPCLAIYVQPKRSHTLVVQFTRVSSCFFTIILYCMQVYFICEKWV